MHLFSQHLTTFIACFFIYTDFTVSQQLLISLYRYLCYVCEQSASAEENRVSGPNPKVIDFYFSFVNKCHFFKRVDKKRFSILKFNESLNVKPQQWPAETIQLEREDNRRQGVGAIQHPFHTIHPSDSTAFR